MEKTSVRANGLIWFGAAISLAEIMTGALFAPLGWWRGIAAIVLGHIIGCILLYAAGLIGAHTRLAAMQSTAISFGQQGSRFFAMLNLIQLVGWTAVMIAGGAVCANSLYALGSGTWSVILGALVGIWILVGVTRAAKLNSVTMSALFLLTLFASYTLIGHAVPAVVPDSGISFGAAIELSVAMPLSWLPLIGDYTRHAEKPRAATLVSALIYGVSSIWMYIVGLGLALYAGGQDLAVFLGGLGFGAAAIIIVLFSTVTTTFLDVHSAGVSAGCLCGVPVRPAAIVVCAVGTILAIAVPSGAYEDFLYLIGSAFAPMITILITDVFVLRRSASKMPLDTTNIILWAIGVAIYRFFLTLDTPFGNTVPMMFILFILCIVVRKLLQLKKLAN